MSDRAYKPETPYTEAYVPPYVVGATYPQEGQHRREPHFADFIADERARLKAAQADIAVQARALQDQLAEINRELAAIDAYEATKLGKPARAQEAAPANRKRSGSRRDAIVSLLGDRGPLTRGELLDALGVKGDKSGEMSVSNALTAMKRQGAVIITERGWMLVA